MSGLVWLFATVFLVFVMLLYFLREKDSPEFMQSYDVPQVLESYKSGEIRDLRFLPYSIFSERDWNFVQNEQSPFLHRLFLEERRAVAIHWLKERAAWVRAIRANHLQRSRYSKNLNVFAEARLLFLFFYLLGLCRCLLLIVQIANANTLRSIALHFEAMTQKLVQIHLGFSNYAPTEEKAGFRS